MVPLVMFHMVRCFDTLALQRGQHVRAHVHALLGTHTHSQERYHAAMEKRVFTKTKAETAADAVNNAQVLSRLPNLAAHTKGHAKGW